MAYPPIHCGIRQRMPAGIVTHMGVEGKGKISEEAKLKPRMAIWLYDEKFGKMNDEFEKVWIFKIIGEEFGMEPEYGCTFIFSPSCITLFQSIFPPHLLQF